MSLKVRRLLPQPLRQKVRNSKLYIKQKCELDNIYHCCVQKTASRWLRGILSDHRVYRYSGMNLMRPGFELDQLNLYEKFLSNAYKPGYIISPIYISHSGFRTLEKPVRHKAFFVLRDPRDIIVSWYYSARWSHSIEGNPMLARVREQLEGLDDDDGLRYSIAHLHEYGLFDAMRSWLDAEEADDRIKCFKYEDLVGGGSFDWFRRLFTHLEIYIPDRVMQGLLDEHSFDVMAKRKNAVSGDDPGHYRKGRPGDWSNHLRDHHLDLIRETIPDALAALGYSS